MESLDAVEKVLTQAAKPLHYQDITTRTQKQGLWHTDGKTPEATINARLGVDIKKYGERSRFLRTGPGTFALREWGLEEYLPVEKPNQPPVSETNTKYSFTDAAEIVLDTYAEKRPMHYRDITERILELGLVNTQGLTPEATLYAMILTEIRRNAESGKTPRFVKYGQGIVGLRKWMGKGLAYQIEQQNQEVQKKLLKHLQSLTSNEFEELLGRLLSELGFEQIDVTGRSGDGGIDVRGTLVVGGVIRTKMAIQAKKWKNNIQSPVVQQVRGSLGTHEQGMIITTSDFSKGAVNEAARSDAIPVALVNGQQLVDLLIEHQILVKRVPYELINLDVDEKGGKPD
jgi:restriction system protein